MEIKLLIAFLATFRIAQLFPQDDGPFFIFKRIRKYTTEKEIEENEEFGFWSNISEGINCVYCMGIYSAIFCAGIMVWDNYIGNLFLLIMALAGGQTFLERLSNRND